MSAPPSPPGAGPGDGPADPLASILADFDRRDADRDRSERGHQIGLRCHTLWEDLLGRPVAAAVPAWVDGWERFGAALRDGDIAAAVGRLGEVCAQLAAMQHAWEAWQAALSEWFTTEAEPWNAESRAHGGPEYPRHSPVYDGRYTELPAWIIQLPWSPAGPRAIPGAITSHYLFGQLIAFGRGDAGEVFREVAGVYAAMGAPGGAARVFDRFRQRDRVAALAPAVAATILPCPDIVRRFLDANPSDVACEDARLLFHVTPDRIRRLTFNVLESALAARAAPILPVAPADHEEVWPDLPSIDSKVSPLTEGGSDDIPAGPSECGPDELTLTALVRVYTNGLADTRIQEAARVLRDSELTTNEKLTKIDSLIRFPPTASAERLGDLLGVSKQAVLKTDWWIENRKGEKASEIGRRLAGHQRRAKDIDPPDMTPDQNER